MVGERDRPEDILEELLSADRAGEVGAREARGDETGELSALRDVAGDMRVARASIPPSDSSGALAAMLNQVEKSRMSEQTGGMWAAVAGWWKRPALRTGAAVTAVVLVLGGASLGAAAATGNEPARNLLGISSSSTIKVEFTGTVVSVNGPVVEVSANGDIRVVIIDENTDLKGDDDTPLPLDGILAGQVVEVHGRLQADNSILATRFELEDDSNTIGGTPTAGVPTAAPTTSATAAVPTAQATVFVPTAPAAQPTFDDDDDDDQDDNSGHGNDDDGDDEDNPGQGNGNGPDGDRDDDDDDAADDNNSGSGSDGEDDDDDNSGSGSDGEGDDDDNSGSGSGDDDDDDD